MSALVQLHILITKHPRGRKADRNFCTKQLTGHAWPLTVFPFESTASSSGLPGTERDDVSIYLGFDRDGATLIIRSGIEI